MNEIETTCANTHAHTHASACLVLRKHPWENTESCDKFSELQRWNSKLVWERRFEQSMTDGNSHKTLTQQCSFNGKKNADAADYAVTVCLKKKHDRLKKSPLRHLCTFVSVYLHISEPSIPAHMA